MKRTISTDTIRAESLRLPVAHLRAFLAGLPDAPDNQVIHGLGNRHTGYELVELTVGDLRAVVAAAATLIEEK